MRGAERPLFSSFQDEFLGYFLPLPEGPGPLIGPRGPHLQAETAGRALGKWRKRSGNAAKWQRIIIKNWCSCMNKVSLPGGPLCRLWRCGYPFMAQQAKVAGKALYARHRGITEGR